MINVSDFTKELFARWYPHDVAPTADEWAQVPQHLAPVQAIQFIKRARMLTLKQGATRHPSQEEVAAVSKYKSSKEHYQQIAAFGAKEIQDAPPIQRRISTKESSNSAPRNIQRARNSKAKRNKRK